MNALSPDGVGETARDQPAERRVADATSPERLLAIFETFERERRPLSAKELALACRMPASTCHNLVHMLVRHSYLYQTGQRKDLYPTRRLYDLGATIVAHDQVLQRLLPAMEQLRAATRETVILGKRQKDHVVYLEVLESPEVIRYSARAGDTKPLHSTCIGKTMLAALPDADIRALFDQLAPTAVTPATITDREALIRDLDRGRARGFFTTRGENVVDVTALAVPICVNNELFGLAVAGPSHRVDASYDQIALALQDAQRSLLEQGIAGRS
jgi:IclR family transcriptional regulator, acetate operon repressor